MNIKFSILLYSKYSKYSKEFISIIENSSVNIIEIFNLKLICIDNEIIRKKILNSQQIDIKSVPCLLIIYEDGGVEKYENENIFQWVENVIQQFTPTNLPSEKSINNEIQQVKEPDNINIEKNINEKNINIEKNIETKSKKNVSKKEIQTITPIEDLDTEDEDNNILNEDDTITPSQIEQVESTNAMSAKKNDLMSLATSMQKSREIFVEKTEKPKFGGTRS